MSKRNVYMIIVKASLSYAWKKHTYMTTWIAVCLLVGLCGCIVNMSISDLIYGVVAALLPLIALWIGRALIGLDSWERNRFQMKKMRKKELFMQYLKEYTEKAIRSK